jgi:hypothetical protein
MALPIVKLASAATSLISEALWQSSQVPPKWGVFDDQLNQVLFPDSVLEFSYRREFDVSDFPVQEGAFASYNKVIKPFEIQLRFSRSGTLQNRQSFLATLEDLVQSLDLYTVITPEGTYPDCNPQRYEVTRRGAQGAFFLTEVDLYLVQIIQVTAQFANTAVSPLASGVTQYIALPNAQSDSAQPYSNVGTVQPQDPNSALAASGQLALLSVNPARY